MRRNANAPLQNISLRSDPLQLNDTDLGALEILRTLTIIVAYFGFKWLPKDLFLSLVAATTESVRRSRYHSYSEATMSSHAHATPPACRSSTTWIM